MGPQAIIALVLAAACFGGGWKIRDWKAAADERATAKQVVDDAKRRARDADTAAAFYESSKAKQDVRERVVIKEVTRIVSRPVLQQVCFDDDALKVLADDVSARAGSLPVALP